MHRNDYGPRAIAGKLYHFEETEDGRLTLQPGPGFEIEIVHEEME